MDSSYYGQLRIFHAIAKEQGVSRGARKLGITTASASGALKLLEQKIGVSLFNRSTRHITLTDAGYQLLIQTQNAMNELEQALDNIQELGTVPMGMVRITLSRFAYQLLLKPYLTKFYDEYPQIQLEISLNDGMANLVEDGFDLGIRFGNRIEDGMVARQLIGGFAEGLYVSKSYAQEFGVPKTLADLPNHRLIGYRFVSSGRIEPLVLSVGGQETTVAMPTPLLCNDSEVIADATRQGLGIGRIFTVNMAQFADRDNFIPILSEHWRHYPAVYLYYLRHKQRAKKVQAVIEFLLANTLAVQESQKNRLSFKPRRC